MIYTVTLNPSIDYIVFTEDFKLGQLNRSRETFKFAGGKGINVSRVLKAHDVNSTALGFIGGFPGKFIQDKLEQDGIETDFVNIQQDTRINVKLKGDTETEINAPGPAVSESEEAALIEQIKQLTSNDIVVLSGSIPASMRADIYQEIAHICHQQGITFVVDAEKELLETVLPFGPSFVKPNKEELEVMSGRKLNSDMDIKNAALQLIKKGAEKVMVSMGGEGALLVTESIVYRAQAPKGTVVNTVGAGDSTVAGMIAGLSKGRTLQDSFRWAVASGSATAFTSDLATKEQIEQLMDEVHIEIV